MKKNHDRMVNFFLFTYKETLKIRILDRCGWTGRSLVVLWILKPLFVKRTDNGAIGYHVGLANEIQVFALARRERVVDSLSGNLFVGKKAGTQDMGKDEMDDAEDTENKTDDDQEPDDEQNVVVENVLRDLADE